MATPGSTAVAKIAACRRRTSIVSRLKDMQFMSFYAQPSCTPGRAAVQTGRIPNRSGMTTVAFQGQGGGLPAAEWTLASVLKTGGYKTFFSGKWHLGEADYAIPNAQGYDEMKYADSIISMPTPTPIRPGFPTWTPNSGRCSRRSPKARCPEMPGSRRKRISRSTDSTSTRRTRAWSASPSSTTMSRRPRSNIWIATSPQARSS